MRGKKGFPRSDLHGACFICELLIFHLHARSPTSEMVGEEGMRVARGAKSVIMRGK
jgi:hypothetical protein